MGLKPIKRVRVRKEGWNPKRGEPTLGVTIPREVKLFFNVEAGQIAEVFVDEENKRIVYQLLE